jgi:hypothetical protein
VTLPKFCKNDGSKIKVTHKKFMEQGFSSCDCEATLAVQGLKVFTEGEFCHYAKLGYTLSQSIGSSEWSFTDNDDARQKYQAEYEKTEAC